MTFFRRALALILIVMGLLLTACGAMPPSPPEVDPVEMWPVFKAVTLAEGEKLRVVATTSIVGDVVAQVGGDAISLTVLMEPGQDAHAYQTSAQDLGTASQAHVIFVNGFNLEESLLQDLNRATEGIPMVSLSTGIEPLKGRHEAHEEHALGESEQEEASHLADHALDPHVWFDVSHVKTWTENIKQLLVKLDPAHADTYTNNAYTYEAELTALDEYVRQMLNTIPKENRKLVTNHESFGYFANAYGFEVIGTVIPSFSTASEPSASDLTDLIQIIKDEKVPAIFVETTASDKLAQIISEETGASVYKLYSDAIGSAGSGADSYIGMMRANVETILEGLVK